MKPASEILKGNVALRNAYKNLFESADGRAVIADLEREVGESGSLYSENVYETLHNVGKRSLLVYIKRMIREADNA